MASIHAGGDDVAELREATPEADDEDDENASVSSAELDFLTNWTQELTAISPSDIEFVANLTQELTTAEQQLALIGETALTDSAPPRGSRRSAVPAISTSTFTSGTQYNDISLFRALHQFHNGTQSWVEPSPELLLQSWDFFEVMLVLIIFPTGAPRDITYFRHNPTYLEDMAQPVMKSFASPLATVYKAFCEFRASLQLLLDYFPEATTTEDTTKPQPTLTEHSRDSNNLSPVALGTPRHTRIVRLSRMGYDLIIAMMSRPTEECSSAVAIATRAISKFCIEAINLTADMKSIVQCVNRVKDVLQASSNSEQCRLTNGQILAMVTENADAGIQFDMRKYRIPAKVQRHTYTTEEQFTLTFWAPIAEYIRRASPKTGVQVNSDLRDPTTVPDKNPIKSGPCHRPDEDMKAAADAGQVTKIIRNPRKHTVRGPRHTVAAYLRRDNEMAKACKLPKLPKRKRTIDQYRAPPAKRQKVDKEGPTIIYDPDKSKYHRLNRIDVFDEHMLPVPFESGVPSLLPGQHKHGYGGSDCYIQGASLNRCLVMGQQYMLCTAAKKVTYHTRNRGIVPLLDCLKVVMQAMNELKGFVIPFIEDGMSASLLDAGTPQERLRVETFTRAQNPTDLPVRTERPLEFIEIQEVGAISTVLGVMAAAPHVREYTDSANGDVAAIARRYMDALLTTSEYMHRFAVNFQTAVLEGFQRLLTASHSDFGLDQLATSMIKARFTELLTEMDKYYDICYGSTDTTHGRRLEVGLGVIAVAPDPLVYEHYMKQRCDAVFLMQKLRPGSFGETERPLLTAEDLRIDCEGGYSSVQGCEKLFGPMNLRHRAEILADLAICGVTPGTAAKGNAIQTKQEAYTRHSKVRALIAAKEAAERPAICPRDENGLLYGSSAWVAAHAKKDPSKPRVRRGSRVSKKQEEQQRRAARMADLQSGKIRQGRRDNGGGGGQAKRGAVLAGQKQTLLNTGARVVNEMADLHNASHRNGARRTKTGSGRLMLLRQKIVEPIRVLHQCAMDFVVAIANNPTFYGEETTQRMLDHITWNHKDAPAREEDIGYEPSERPRDVPDTAQDVQDWAVEQTQAMTLRMDQAVAEASIMPTPPQTPVVLPDERMPATGTDNFADTLANMFESDDGDDFGHTNEGGMESTPFGCSFNLFA